MPHEEVESCWTCICNIWFPREHPAYKNPLAMLDASSVDVTEKSGRPRQRVTFDFNNLIHGIGYGMTQKQRDTACKTACKGQATTPESIEARRACERKAEAGGSLLRFFGFLWPSLVLEDSVDLGWADSMGAVTALGGVISGFDRHGDGLSRRGRRVLLRLFGGRPTARKPRTRKHEHRESDHQHLGASFVWFLANG